MSRIIKADHLLYTNVRKDISKIKEEGQTKTLSQTSQSSDEKDIIYKETKQMVEEMIVNAKQKAERILIEARVNSEALLEEAKAELKVLQDEAYNEGYLRGKEKVEEDLRQTRENAENLLKQAFSEKEKIIKDSEKEILNFIVDTLDRICLNYLTNKQEIILEISKELLTFVKDARGQVVLKTSARDYPFIEYHLDDLKMILTSGNLSIRVDNKLSTGHCIVISENGVLEVDLDENLEKVKAVLQDVVIDD